MAYMPEGVTTNIKLQCAFGNWRNNKRGKFHAQGERWRGKHNRIIQRNKEVVFVSVQQTETAQPSLDHIADRIKYIIFAHAEAGIEHALVAEVFQFCGRGNQLDNQIRRLAFGLNIP